ncbi:MAG: hypothetical protein FJ290_27220 [Planctomycetes bacterium]|nr:hypothetical protein [Planctomycetota bacterium]
MSWFSHRSIRLPLAAAVGCLLAASAARADRASENMDPAYMFEKAGKFDLAAMYYHRALRGVVENYVAFHFNRDPANYATGKYATEYVQLPKEFEERYKSCLAQAKLAPEQLKRMEFLNYLWMCEFTDEDFGGVRTELAVIAPVAERYGDFRLGEFCRRGEARYYRAVAIPFHEKCAKELDAAGQKALAATHRMAVKAYAERARRADLMALGDKALMAHPSLGGPGRYIGDGRYYPDKVNPVAFQYIRQRLFDKENHAKGMPPDMVARILKADALVHGDEHVRLAAVATLAQLGDTDALLDAIGDSSPLVHQAAAEALSAAWWANGWGACHHSKHPAAKAAVADLLAHTADEPLSRTWVITELIRGLGSASAKTAAFCHDALQTITGKKLAKDEWATWWKGLGNARPGLTRKAPDGTPGTDLTLDFGAWWQSGYQTTPNPLVKYEPPAAIEWDGHIFIPRDGEYRFYARNCGEGKTGKNSVVTPGRIGFPGLYLSAPSATVVLDGKPILPHPTDAVQDPCGGTRLDLSEPLRLTKGLHRIQVKFDYRSRPTGFWDPQPCLRLYWSSDHFPRQVIPAQHLISKDAIPQ